MGAIFNHYSYCMKTPSASIKRLPLQTCLLINQSAQQEQLETLLAYLLEPSIPTIVSLDAFETVLQKCPFQNVILITNDFEGLQEKLQAKQLQKLLKAHRFHVLVLQKETPLFAFPYLPHIRYVNGLDGTLLPYQLKREVQRELRFIRRKILKSLVEASRAQRAASAKLKTQDFQHKFDFLIHSHYANPRFTTADLAKKMQVSISTLERKTVELTGKTPKQYLLAYRLQKAKDDLSTSYRKVGQVAKTHGFASSSYFSVSFFERFGFNPSQARQREAVTSVG